MLRLAFDFIITWRETRTRPNAYHPSSEKHHTHTTGQVISIAHLSTIQTLEPGGQTEMTVFRPVLYVLEYKTNTFRAKVLCAQCIHLRAPPFYC